MKKAGWQWAGVFALVGAVTIFTTCSSPGPDNGTSAVPDTGTFTIGMSQCNLGEPWRVQMNSDIEKAAKEHPELRVIFKDAQNQTTIQQSHVREFVGQGVDLIIVSPLEAAPLTGPIAEAYKSGIPVIVLDRAVLGEDFTMFIGADNVCLILGDNVFYGQSLSGTLRSAARPDWPS